MCFNGARTANYNQFSANLPYGKVTTKWNKIFSQFLRNTQARLLGKALLGILNTAQPNYKLLESGKYGVILIKHISEENKIPKLCVRQGTCIFYWFFVIIDFTFPSLWQSPQYIPRWVAKLQTIPGNWIPEALGQSCTWLCSYLNTPTITHLGLSTSKMPPYKYSHLHTYLLITSFAYFLVNHNLYQMAAHLTLRRIQFVFSQSSKLRRGKYS